MRDYLGHLAARSLAPEPIVRPRLLTLFESPRLGTSSFFGDKEAVSPADSGAATDSNSTRSAESVSSRTEPPAGPIHPQTRPATASTVLDPLRAKTENAVPPTERQKNSSLLPPVQAQTGDQTGRHAAASSSTPDHPDGTPQKLAPSGSAAPRDPLPNKPATIFPRVRVERNSGNGVGAALPKQSNATSEPLPPQVQVTIGRLEIRATLPTGNRSAPHAASDAGRKLNDYLRRRVSGKRS